MGATQWPAEIDAWLIANPEAAYPEFRAAFPSETRSYQAWFQHRTGLLGAGRPKPRRGLAVRRAMALPETREIVGYQTVVEDAPDELYERLFALTEETDSVLAQLAPTQESTEWEPADEIPLPVWVGMTGDWHLGQRGVWSERLLEDLTTVRATPGAYLIGMGDYVEGVNIHSKAVPALYSGLLNDGNLQDMYALLRMARAAGKWVAFVKGNHDDWMTRAAGVSRVDRLIERLGQRGQRPPLFCQGGGTVFATVGGQRYVIAVTHNAKGNSQLNTSNAQRRTFDAWPQWENCDVICCGHLHYNDLHVPPRKGGRCVYLRSGTYKIRDGYAADNGFTPEYGVPGVILYPDQKHVIPWRGDDFAHGLRFLANERARYRAIARETALALGNVTNVLVCE
jgi:UDP-2,3-diacylglucosamine pyrophosphatase LpxH